MPSSMDKLFRITEEMFPVRETIPVCWCEAFPVSFLQSEQSFPSREGAAALAGCGHYIAIVLNSMCAILEACMYIYVCVCIYVYTYISLKERWHFPTGRIRSQSFLKITLHLPLRRKLWELVVALSGSMACDSPDRVRDLVLKVLHLHLYRFIPSALCVCSVT